MPDGSLKTALMSTSPDDFPDANSVTYAKTSAITSLRIDGADSSWDWSAGADFLPNLTSITISSSPDITFPAEGLDGFFTKLSTFESDDSVSRFSGVTLISRNVTSFTMRNWKAGAVSFEGIGDALPGVTSLNLSRSLGIQSLSGISGLTKLTSLSADRLGLSSLSGVEGLSNLQTLSASGNPLSDVPSLAALTKLSSLNLSSDSLSKIPDLPVSGNLKTLNLSENAISDWRALPESLIEGLNADGQTIVSSDIQTGKNVELSNIVKLPSHFSAATWSASQLNAPSLSADGAMLKMWTPGSWTLDFTATAGSAVIGGEVKGNSTGAGTQPTVAVANSSTAVAGGPATFTAEVTGADNANVSSYSWYPSKSASLNLSLVDAISGESSSKLTVAHVSPAVVGKYYFASAVVDGFTIYSAKGVQLDANVEIKDAAFKSCLADRAGLTSFTAVAMAGFRTSPAKKPIDCSGMAITSIDGIQYLSKNIGSLDLSHNNISDVSPFLASANSPFFETVPVNLSYNAVTSVAPLASDSTLLSKTGTKPKIDLSHNKIADLSALASLDGPRAGTASSVLATDQALGVSGAKVGDRITLPTVKAADGSSVALTSADGTIDNGTISFTTPGQKTATWEKATVKGVDFSGTVSIPVGVGAAATVAPTQPQAGESMTVSVVGFGSDENVTVSVGGRDIGSLYTDGSGAGSQSVLVPSDLGGSTAVTVKGQTSGTEKTVTVQVLAARVVTAPDQGLNRCLHVWAGIPTDKPLYAPDVERKTDILDCRSQRIKDLTGLDQLTFNTSRIDLRNNEITSLASLGKLSMAADENGAKTLDVSNNLITNATTEGAQPDVDIVANDNAIRDFTPLRTEFRSFTAFEQQPVLSAVLTKVSVPMPGVTAQGQNSADRGALTFGAPEQLVAQGGGQQYLPSTAAHVKDGTVSFDKAGDYRIPFTVGYDKSSDRGASQGSGSFVITVVERAQQRVKFAVSKDGRVVNMLVTGQEPGASVTFSLQPGGIQLGSAVVNSMGVAQLSNVLIPATVTPGRYQIEARSSNGAMRSTDYLTVSLRQSSGGPTLSSLAGRSGVGQYKGADTSRYADSGSSQYAGGGSQQRATGLPASGE